jgi:hypothetical protein
MGDLDNAFLSEEMRSSPSLARPTPAMASSGHATKLVVQRGRGLKADKRHRQRQTQTPHVRGSWSWFGLLKLTRQVCKCDEMCMIKRKLTTPLAACSRRRHIPLRFANTS